MVQKFVSSARVSGWGLGMPHVTSYRYASRLLFLRRALTEDPLWASSVLGLPSLALLLLISSRD